MQNESVVESGFLPALIPAGRTKVPAAHLGFQQQGTAILLERAQLSHPLSRLPIRHTRVVQTRGNKDLGILLGLDILIRCVGLNVVVVRLLSGVPPTPPIRRP